MSGDSYWVQNGTENISVNASFCNEAAGDYHLYSYSPNAPNVSPIGLIGAYDVGCSPSANIYPNNPNITACPPNSCADDPTIHVCPGGDFQKLVVHVELDTLAMTRDIDSTEIELIPPVSNTIFFWCNGPLYADSAATAENYWKTTITYGNISAYAPTVPCLACSADTLHVMLDNTLLGSFKVRFKSPDATGAGGPPDGRVNLADLVPFGGTWYKCKGDSHYNDCFNFATQPNDICVNLSDFVEWSDHYQCKAPCIGAAVQATRGAPSDVAMRFAAQLETVDKERYVNISVSLKNARDITSCCLVLNGDQYGLDFVKWEESPVENGTILATPIEKEGVNEFLICLLAEDPIKADKVCLGTVRYRLKTQSQAPFDDKISLLNFGEFMRSDGTVQELGGGRIEVEGEVTTYYDYLNNCYPNPFNPTTTMEYSISRDSHVNLSIYNANGQLVRTLVNEHQKKNIYKVAWDGRDNGGRGVAAGIYFCRLKSDFFERSQKLIMLR